MQKKRLIDMDTEDLAELIRILLNEEKPEPNRFITPDEAKELLNCSTTTLYYLRSNGDISYVQNEKHRKLILYDRVSIMNYLEKNLKKAF